jgi:hypothetical protein
MNFLALFFHIISIISEHGRTAPLNTFPYSRSEFIFVQQICGPRMVIVLESIPYLRFHFKRCFKTNERYNSTLYRCIIPQYCLQNCFFFFTVSTTLCVCWPPPVNFSGVGSNPTPNPPTFYICCIFVVITQKSV